MKDFIGPFELYKKTPNDISYGHIYTMDVILPVFYYKPRTVRVYLPEDYDEKKKYPLLVMSDGQNIVDRYTSAYGAWEIDKRQHELIKEGRRSFIVVGIDCPVGPSERAMEYSFPHIMISRFEEGRYANKFKLQFESHILYEYINDTLLPLVKTHFSVSDNLSDIGCGGSSMGGVFALSLLMSYPKSFGFALCFSPGYFLYPSKKVDKFLEERISEVSLEHKFFFYSGNVGFEARFKEDTIRMHDYFIYKGFSPNNVGILIDEKGEHNEYNWSKHFNEAIRFLMAK